MNAVLVKDQADRVQEGSTFTAKVPLRPYSTMQDGGTWCADHESHLTLTQSVYWYLWNPDHRGCNIVPMDMKITVERVLPRNPETYPEYDRLWEDGRLDVVVLFAKLDDGDVSEDQNWDRAAELADWLEDAGFTEDRDAPLGRRFVREVDGLVEVVDIYGPDLFHSVADYERLSNWQKAVSEHEVIMYNGHSVLGTGMAFEQVAYPDKYQIFQVASCLSYEYYVQPILQGKGSWDDVDVVANVEPTYFSEMLPLTATILAKLLWGFEHGGKASWQDIMEAASAKLGHALFGVSGARDNCFTPEGSRCDGDPGTNSGFRKYEWTDGMDIPDDDPEGVTATITVGESVTIGVLTVSLDISHTWVRDLEIVLSHGGVSRVLWSREGGGADDIVQTFQVRDFDGMDAAGEWTLHVVDHSPKDTGRLNSWSLAITPKGD